MARFYGWSNDHIESLTFEEFNDYWESITVIEASEMLYNFTIQDWSQMKDNDRSKLHSKMQKMARPFDKKEGKVLSNKELFKILKSR